MKEFIVDEDFHPDVSGYPELVRCKDCIKHGDIACPLWTDAVEWETDADWFCADGEQRG